MEMSQVAIRQLALLDHMVIDGDGKLCHTHWPQGKMVTKGISLQWVVPKLQRDKLLVLHTPFMQSTQPSSGGS